MDCYHYDEFHPVVRGLIRFADTEPEASDIVTDQPEIELFADVARIHQIVFLLFTVYQDTVFSIAFEIHFPRRDNTDSGPDFRSKPFESFPSRHDSLQFALNKSVFSYASEQVEGLPFEDCLV